MMMPASHCQCAPSSAGRSAADGQPDAVQGPAVAQAARHGVLLGRGRSCRELGGMAERRLLNRQYLPHALLPSR